MERARESNGKKLLVVDHVLFSFDERWWNSDISWPTKATCKYNMTTISKENALLPHIIYLIIGDKV